MLSQSVRNSVSVVGLLVEGEQRESVQNGVVVSVSQSKARTTAAQVETLYSLLGSPQQLPISIMEMMEEEVRILKKYLKPRFIVENCVYY